MIENNSIESIEHNSIDTSNVNNQLFRLNKISEIEHCFIPVIKERELMSKKLSKYISFFDYFDKSLIVLSVRSDGVSIASFSTVIGAHIGIISASLSLAFSLCTGLVKKLLKATRNKKKKHNKIVMLPMLSYCLKCNNNNNNKKNTESVDPNISATSNGRTMIL